MAAIAAGMVTAPSPGGATSLRAGEPRPPSPPPTASSGGYVAEVLRAMLAVKPPGHAADPAGGAGNGKCCCHSTRERSVSTAKTVLDAPPKKASERKPR